MGKTKVLFITKFILNLIMSSSKIAFPNQVATQYMIDSLSGPVSITLPFMLPPYPLHWLLIQKQKF